MQQQNDRAGVLRRVVRRARRSLGGGAGPAGQRTPVAARDDADPAGRGAAPRAGSGAHLRQVRAELAQVRALIEAEEREREQLKAERRRLQEELGAQHGKRVLPRLKVEKTNGVPSLVAGARMMQRVHARADDPDSGIDGAGAVFADQVRTEEFVRSHGVPISIDLAAEPDVIVHAFQGETPLVELRAGDRVRHVTPRGQDVGDIRPGVRYDPDIPLPGQLDRIVRASRTLSAHVPRPYVQVTWCAEAALLTGIDVDPRRIPVLTDEWDQRLGKAFDSGHARMLMQPYRAGALDNRAPDGTFRYEETV